MSSSFGKNIKVTIFGESHSAAIGAVVDGVPAGYRINMDEVIHFMQRRAPGRDAYSTTRQEKDLPEVVSGIVDGVTCGTPIGAVIRNTDTRSGDYENLRRVPRPGHADFTAHIKYGKAHDIRGGGHFSGRLTAPLCFAGALCSQILENSGIKIGTHIASIYNIKDHPFDPVLPDKNGQLFDRLKAKPFPVIDDGAGEAMKEAIDKARRDLDSVGGIVECAVTGLPAGLGEPMFGGVENRLSSVVFGIPAVKGMEFGAGFEAAHMNGSENNDPFYMKGDRVKTKTNNHGGILGGITSSMPLIFRTAFKPTPSISREQASVDLQDNTDTPLVVKGRHDPCIVPRAVPCVEAAAAVVILDLMMDAKDISI